MATTHVLTAKHNDNVLFTRFVVNGDQVEVTRYVDSDLEWEKTVTRDEARRMWRGMLEMGWSVG